MGAAEVISSHCSTLASRSADVRSRQICELDLPYGTAASETIDFVLPARDAPVLPKVVVYLHGGMWQALSKADSLFMAEPLTRIGIIVAAVEYDVAPKGACGIQQELGPFARP